MQGKFLWVQVEQELPLGAYQNLEIVQQKTYRRFESAVLLQYANISFDNFEVFHIISCDICFENLCFENQR